MRTFEVKVSREPGWWMITIPEIDGLTSAKTYTNVASEARSYICEDQNLPPAEVGLLFVG